MRKIGLRLLGAFAGALPFVLAAGQAAEAQTCTPAPTPTPAQPPSPDLTDKIAAVAGEYCDRIARARTSEEVQHIADELANTLTRAPQLIQLQSQKTAQIAQAQATLNADEQARAQRRAASPLPQIESLIQTDQQAMADARANAAAAEANGVNGGPSLSTIDQHIQETTALANRGVNPAERQQARGELALWQAKRNELMAAKADYAAAYTYAANDLAQQQVRLSAAKYAFDQAQAGFEALVEQHRKMFQEAQLEASYASKAVQKAAPYLQGAQSLRNLVIQCGQRRVAQMQGTMPPPYAPQASPAPSPQTAPPPNAP